MNLPLDFVKKYQKLLGEESLDFLSSFDQSRINAFRVNRLKNHSDFSSYSPLGFIPNAYYGKIPGRQIESLAGVVYSQDPSAMCAAKILAPTEDDLVLDLCAAPGGKTTYLADQINNKGFVLANDIDLKRAKILSENVGRMGYWNVAVSNESPDSLATKFPAVFSKILVDAPCSGEGMFRKDPSAIQYWDEGYPRSCARVQKKVLKSALEMLAPGGTLVYSTCTFSPEENEGVVNYTLKHNHDLQLLPIIPIEGSAPGIPEYGEGNPELSKCMRLYPHLFSGEGQFIAKFKKIGSSSANPYKVKRASKISSIYSEFERSTFIQKIPEVFQIGDVYYSLNSGFYELIKDAHLIKKGVKIGTIKKQRFIPDQEIFLALPQSSIETVIDLDEEQFAAYCHGEEIQFTNKSPIKRWVALSFKGYVFGFGHWVGNRIKNFYPKNLRH